MKQHEVMSRKELSGKVFYIRPFPAFVAANISGELASLVTPLIAGMAPMAVTGEETGTDIMDIDLTNVSSLSNALSNLSGDKVESLLKKLLTKHRNISVDNDAGGVDILTDDLANEVFCGTVQDMFILAAEVINVNFKGFFKKIGDRFGLRKAAPEEESPSTNTEDSTQPTFQSLN